MTQLKDLIGLQQLSKMMLDQQLDQMRAASAALERSKAQLAAISEAAAPADLPLIAGARAEMIYQCWADLRRSDLNLVIARQTVDWLAARENAKAAFGRLQALIGLAGKIERR